MCDFVMETMQHHDSDGFNNQDPTTKRIHWEPKVPIGTNEWWSADQHDKPYGIGFPVWAIVEDATGQWLDCWVVPSNCMGHVVLYLFLCAIKDIRGRFFQQNTKILFAQECHFRYQLIVDQRQLNSMQW